MRHDSIIDRLKLIGDHFVDCFTIVEMDSPQRPCVYVNTVFEQNTGYCAEEAVGRNLGFLQGDGTSAATVELMQRAFAQRSACCVDILNYRKDGSAFMNRLVMLPIEREDTCHYLGFQNVLSQEIQRDDQGGADVSHGEINHMLNSPLSALIMATDLALEYGDKLETHLGECQDIFEQINTFCRHIDRPDKFKSFNPFRNA